MRMKFNFSTSNPHKVSEANGIGRKYGIRFKQVSIPYPEIRAEDVADVAKEGADFVFNTLKEPVMVEDSGLYIDALEGFPGAFSSFVFKKIGCRGILKLMEGVKVRGARFVSAIGYHDSLKVHLCVGEVKGRISKEIKGSAGFGYDPIFIPENYDRTFSEDQVMKNRVSHRARSVKKFCELVSGD